MKFLAKTFAGLENILAEELKTLDAQNIQVIKRGVTFEGDMALLYRANLALRTALRILIPIKAFIANDEKTIYDTVKSIDWQRFITVRQTFAVDAVVHSSIFTHSQYIGLKVKDGIADRFRADNKDRRPFVNVEKPDLLVNVHIYENQVTLSLDSSGKSLHQRGWRAEQTAAPLNEVLAAGILAQTGWRGEVPLVDAMCGSATLPIEAALMVSNTPPQYKREHFCFQSWKNFDTALFDEIKKDLEAKIVEPAFPIIASDLNQKALEIAVKNVQSARTKRMVKVQLDDFFQKRGADILEDIEDEKNEDGENKYVLSKEKGKFEGIEGILIMNPPYDERLGLDDAKAFHQQIGDHLKHHWKGWQVWIFTGNLEAAKFIGLKPSARIHLFNGPIECRLLRFDVF